MTDPTTQDDPGALLQRCIELAAKASPGPWTTGDGDPESILSERDYTCIAQANTSFVDRAPANAAAIAAAVNFIRDAAPALLAEVAAARATLAKALDADNVSEEPLRRLAVRASNAIHWRNERCEAAEARAESAERALAGAVELLRETQGALVYANTDYVVGDGWMLEPAINQFLAHHGAGTGDSNE